jgi:hypothetical protein
MQVLNPKTYIDKLRQHYERYFGMTGKSMTLDKGPKEKLYSDFQVLEFPPNQKHSMFSYCTVGMSADRLDDNLIELVVYASKADNSLLELLTICASYHRNVLPLNIHHTVNIGQPWVDDSICDHAFVSLPYLDGQELEMFNFEGSEIHCYWLIPITEKERDFKIENGSEALELLFEEKQIDFLDPKRDSLVK